MPSTGDTTSYTFTHYRWEFQRPTGDVWAHQPGDPAGNESSEYAAAAFARNLLTQHAPYDGEPWQLVVRAESGVGRPLVYTITSDQAFT